MPVGQTAYEEDYRFPMMMEISGVTYHRNGKKQETSIRYYFNVQKSWMATSTVESEGISTRRTDALSLYDFENNTILLLTPSQKAGLAMDLSKTSCLQGPAVKARVPADDNWACIRTGKRKIILSLQCHECICIDEVRNFSATLWVSKDLPVNLAPPAVRSPFASQFRLGQKAGGVLVSGQFYESGVLKSTINLNDLNRNAGFALSLGDYYIR